MKKEKNFSIPAQLSCDVLKAEDLSCNIRCKTIHFPRFVDFFPRFFFFIVRTRGKFYNECKFEQMLVVICIMKPEQLDEKS